MTFNSFPLSSIDTRPGKRREYFDCYLSYEWRVTPVERDSPIGGIIIILISDLILKKQIKYIIFYDWSMKKNEDNAREPLIKSESMVQIKLKKHKQF